MNIKTELERMVWNTARQYLGIHLESMRKTTKNLKN